MWERRKGTARDSGKMGIVCCSVIAVVLLVIVVLMVFGGVGFGS